jgi:unsaturated chondroitin disaccharide hydrolase
MENEKSMLARAEHAFEFAQRQVRALAQREPGLYPLYTQGGKWRHPGTLWTAWGDGFLPGMMWIFFDETGDPEWRRLAESYSRGLEHRKDDRDVHDLGFLFFHGTYRRWYEVTGKEGAPERALLETVIHAGRTLAMRFNERAGCLRSFHGEDSNFIDVMMNVGLIFYAGIAAGDRALIDLAHRHSRTSVKMLVRKDGSTAHEGIFDVVTGEFLRQSTQQGYSAESCWSRGLAWSLYGFGTCYELTGELEYLEVAESNAGYWMSHVPTGIRDYGLAPWDFDAPHQGRLSRGIRDTSASAIAASGLMNLARLSEDAGRSRRYLDCALRTVDTLVTYHLGAAGGEASAGSYAAEWEGILRDGVYHIHKGLGVGESVMWGEYFFVEALQKSLHILRKGSVD